MNGKIYEQRREKLREGMMEQSVLIIFSGPLMKASADQHYPFAVNTNFYYLTGIDQENAVLVLVKTPMTSKTYLFIDEIDELKVRWVGKKLDLESAQKISGIHDIFMNSMLQTRLQEIYAEASSFGKVTHLYLDLEKQLVMDAEGKTTTQYGEDMQRQYPQLSIENAYPMITKLRMVKSKEEVQLIRQAIQATAFGLKQIKKHLKPDLYEYQIEALFQYSIKEFGNHGLAFETIIASGKNAVILHYPNPKDKIVDGALVLCDLGASHHHYRGDITRTYPASGRFNPLQKQIYEIVLKANEAMIQMAKPGLTIVDLQQACTQLLAEACVKAGLLKSVEEIGQVYYHNVGHHLGLDTHDPIARNLTLEPGCVITIEPGLYFKEFGIGVRIEDNILITEKGCENLSIDIPKSVQELEH